MSIIPGLGLPSSCLNVLVRVGASASSWGSVTPHQSQIAVREVSLNEVGNTPPKSDCREVMETVMKRGLGNTPRYSDCCKAEKPLKYMNEGEA